jgi:homoserine kinase
MDRVREVVVEAPASSANLGPGYDVLALALQGPLDTLVLRREEGNRKGISLAAVEGLRAPPKAADNVAGAVVARIAEDHGIVSGISMKLRKEVPVGVGLGSSAASSVCAVVGMNELFGLRLSAKEALEYAGLGEEFASGARHYDNVAASMLGGVVIVRSTTEPEVTRIGVPSGIGLCAVTPRVSLPKRKTEFARSLVPKTVTMEDVIRNVSMAASLVLGFKTGDAGLVGKGMHDFVVEPPRSEMIPGYGRVRERALGSGAAGVCISGAGPTMLAVFNRREASGGRIIRAMVSAFKEEGVRASGFESQVGGGARVAGKK